MRKMVKPGPDGKMRFFANGAEDTLRLVMANAPFVNLWYTRAALDWMLLYHVREMLSPGTLQRTERKMKTAFGQEFLVRPSLHIKRGGGFRQGGMGGAVAKPQQGSRLPRPQE